MNSALISLSGFHGQVSRLTFTYEGDQIRLLSEQIIEMTIATPAETPDQGPASNCVTAMGRSRTGRRFRIRCKPAVRSSPPTG